MFGVGLARSLIPVSRRLLVAFNARLWSQLGTADCAEPGSCRTLSPTKATCTSRRVRVPSQRSSQAASLPSPEMVSFKAQLSGQLPALLHMHWSSLEQTLDCAQHGQTLHTCTKADSEPATAQGNTITDTLRAVDERSLQGPARGHLLPCSQHVHHARAEGGGLSVLQLWWDPCQTAAVQKSQGQCTRLASSKHLGCCSCSQLLGRTAASLCHDHWRRLQPEDPTENTHAAPNPPNPAGVTPPPGCRPRLQA